MRALALAGLLVVVSGCTAANRSSRTPTFSALPARTGPLAELEKRLEPTLLADRSAFKLLERSEEALMWRLALIDSATTSLDLMTFIWWGDEVGDLVLSRVLAAADRGVKVRLIVDDMSTLDESHDMQLRDVPNAAIDAHPNIELRVFNPFQNRGTVGRAVEFLGDFSRLNQRMHNKALIADGHVAIMGGRNVGNEYMGLSEAFNFRDLDVITIGHASRQVSGVFDRYWNSEWVRPQSEIAVGSEATLKSERADLEKQLAAAKILERFGTAPREWSTQLVALEQQVAPGTSSVFTDTPDGDKVTHRLPALVRELWASAQTEVLVTNAYIIPDEISFEQTKTELKPGVRFVMLTNSLGSTDAAGVHVHYSAWRPKMVEGGVELYEFKHDATVRTRVVDTAPVVSKFVGLHAKAMVIDRKRVLIGSMNLDPRSWVHNSEMGILIDCPELGNALANVIESDLKPENSWQVQLDPAVKGQVQWVSGTEVRHQAPVRDESQRGDEFIPRLLPADLY
ncbi:MAG: phospholipase D family protein [Archangium sp.]